MDDLNIALCVPSAGTWSSATALSVAKLVRHFMCGDVGDVHVISAKGFMVPELRSRCVAEAWAREATHLLFVDSDISFPDDALLRLLRHTKPIVGVNYPRKSDPPIPTAYVDNADYTGPLYTTDESTGLEPVKHMGFGLCLIAMEVFDLLVDDLPLFDFEVQPPHKLRWCTEDVYFFRKCRKHEIEAFVDHDLSKEIGHVGQWVFTNAQAEAAMIETRETVSQVPKPLDNDKQEQTKQEKASA